MRSDGTGCSVPPVGISRLFNVRLSHPAAPQGPALFAREPRNNAGRWEQGGPSPSPAPPSTAQAACQAGGPRGGSLGRFSGGPAVTHSPGSGAQGTGREARGGGGGRQDSQPRYAWRAPQGAAGAGWALPPVGQWGRSARPLRQGAPRCRRHVWRGRGRRAGVGGTRRAGGPAAAGRCGAPVRSAAAGAKVRAALCLGGQGAAGAHSGAGGERRVVPGQ